MLRLLAVVLGACFASHAYALDLTVSAAASLTNAFRELAPMFEAENPGVRVQLNFAGSGALLQQIAKGAPVDVFASADQLTMNQAQEQGLVKASERRNFVSNALVVVVPASAGQPPATLNALLQPAYERIAFGQATNVPVGRYTKSVLEERGLWSAIEPKMIAAQNVRQALDYVARAEVDAGFVYATDAAIMPGKVKVAFNVPTSSPILYPVAPVAASSHYAVGQAFVAFLANTEAQAVLARHGFGQP